MLVMGASACLATAQFVDSTGLVTRTQPVRASLSRLYSALAPASDRNRFLLPSTVIAAAPPLATPS
jgi:hypothetical protein